MVEIVARGQGGSILTDLSYSTNFSNKCLEKCGDEEQYLVALPARAVEVYGAGPVAANTVEISEVRVAEIYVASEEDFSQFTNTSRAP